MTVTAVRKDPQALSMTIDAEFDAPAERVWELWADPRQLERWWGPPTYPATFTTHDFRPGGRPFFEITDDLPPIDPPAAGDVRHQGLHFIERHDQLRHHPGRVFRPGQFDVICIGSATQNLRWYENVPAR